MSHKKLSCPRCAVDFEADISSTTDKVRCPNCSKVLRLTRKPPKEKLAGKSRPPKSEGQLEPKAKKPVRETEEVNSFDEKFNSSEDTFDEYADDEFSNDADNHDAPLWNDELDEYQAPALPPRSRKRAKKKGKKGHGNSPAVFAEPRKNIDALTDGTFNKKQHLSEEGGRFIQLLLLRIGTLVAVVAIIGFLRSQFRDAGLVEKTESADAPQGKFEILMAAYDYYSGEADATAEKPGNIATLDDLADEFMKSVRIRPLKKNQTHANWHGPLAKPVDRWLLAPDKGASFEKIRELSESYRLWPVSFAGNLARIEEPNGGNILLDVRTMRGRRLSGSREPKSVNAAGSEFFTRIVDYSPDTGHILRRHGSVKTTQERPNTRRQRTCFVAIHEYDNTWLKTISLGDDARFVSETGVLIEKHETNADGTPDTAFPSRDLTIWDTSQPEAVGSISVPPGGQWVLTPGRRYLVVIEPDQGTVNNLKKDPKAEFDFNAESVFVRIFSTSDGKLVGTGEFVQQTVGQSAVISHDGTRLVLCSATRILILNMENGTIVAHGSMPVDNLQHPRTAWLAGTDYLCVNQAIISVHDGRVVSKSRRNGHVRIPRATLAGQFARDTQNGQFVDFPEAALETLSGPAPNQKIDDFETAVLTVNGTNSVVTKECVKRALQQRLGLEFVSESTPNSLTLDVTYAEHFTGKKHDLDRWGDIDPWNRSIAKKNGRPKEQADISVELSAVLSAPDGGLLASQNVSGSETPINVDFSLPVDVQFRLASLAKITNQLTLEYQMREEAERPAATDAIWAGETPSANVPIEFPVRDIHVDNSWLDKPHGLPLLGK